MSALPSGAAAPAAGAPEAASRRVLDPVERMSEILFGLIMALTFTGTISVAGSGREEIRAILVAAVGCNIAWGLVDAVMYLLNTLTQRSRALLLTRSVRDARDHAAARAVIADALPEALATVARPEILESLREGVAGMTRLPARARLAGRDLLGAIGVFLLVAVSTFPLVVPFLVLREPVRALRVSHAIGLAMLFLVGHSLGRYSGQGGWRMGLMMVGVGLALVALTIALGG